MNDASVKNRIMNSRLEKKLSQQEMADMIGVSRNAYRALEQGKTKMINEHLDKIAEITNTTKEELVLGYKPASEKDLNDIRNSYESRLKFEREQLLAQIEVLRKDLEAKNEMIATQRETIKSQATTISFMGKKSEND